MATVTLHRASRILDAIQKAIKVHEPKTVATVSLFARTFEVEGELTALRRTTRANVDTTERLLSIRGNIRQTVAVENVSVGISPLLASQRTLQDFVAMLERMPGVGFAVKPEPEDEFAMYRRQPKKPNVPPTLNVKISVEMIAATKARFAASDAAVESSIEVGTVTVEDGEAFNKRAVAARRQLDAISDQLRYLNTAHTIEIAEENMNWLTENGVV